MIDLFSASTPASLFDDLPEAPQPKKRFFVWEILSIPAFQFEEEEVVFPHQHRIIFSYLASLADKYGQACSSYLSIMYRTGTDESDEVAYALKWLTHYKLVTKVKIQTERGERIGYDVNYPNNTFPYEVLKPRQER